MSWDVILFILDAPPPAVSTLPADWTPSTFETGTVRRIVSAEFPDTDWSDPTWGLLTGPDWSVEFNTGKEAVTTSITLHLRGGAKAFEVIDKLRKHPGWYAMDTSSGEWIHQMDFPDAGFAAFRAFRDKALAAPLPPVPPPGLMGRLRRFLPF